jgi:hypothetical protein
MQLYCEIDSERAGGRTSDERDELAASGGWAEVHVGSKVFPVEQGTRPV